jgi:hypothetical protein
MSDYEPHMFLVDDSFMYEPDDNIEDSWSSHDLNIESLDSEPGPDLEPDSALGLSIHNLDSSPVLHDEFDWHDAVPGNGWSPQTLVSSQSSSCGSAGSTLSQRAHCLRSGPEFQATQTHCLRAA